MDVERDRIEQIRKAWGERLLILGHHYQDASVIRHADAVGDSLELARRAAAAGHAERIVFCGVRFMAETADILTSDSQSVYMPDVTAGCPMAGMADEHQAETALSRLEASGGRWAPVVYVNSSADVKAFCGRHEGSACTSSNAGRVFRSYLDRGFRVLFLPDEHLGVNTARALGLEPESVKVYDPDRADGGLSTADIQASRVVCWKGFCHVHVRFEAAHAKAVRERFPDARIVVHPECPREVVALADASGSTSQIIRYVREAPAGTTIFVGTENHLVRRLADEERGRVTVHALWPSTCWNMAKTNEVNLLQVLVEWPARQIVRVPPDIRAEALACLQRMLAL